MSEAQYVSDRRTFGRWTDETTLADMYGREFKVGDKVAKAAQGGRAVNISVCEVTRIEGGKLYLSGSKVAVVYPGRLLIVTASVPPSWIASGTA